MIIMNAGPVHSHATFVVVQVVILLHGFPYCTFHVFVFLHYCPFVVWSNFPHFLSCQEPVVLLGTELVASSLHWDLPYLLQNLGSAKHTVYVSKTRDFKYFDDRKVGMFLLKLLANRQIMSK